MTFQNDNEVFEFIKEREGSKEILAAIQQQDKLRLLCFYDKIDPNNIGDSLFGLLPEPKQKVYLDIYKNHSKKLINKIAKQFNKVFHASGGSCEYYIDGVKEKAAFINDMNMVNGVGLMRYFSNRHINFLLSCPSSFYFLENKKEAYVSDGEVEDEEPFELKILSIHRVVSLEIENNCIEAIAYKKKPNSEEYFVLDDTYRYHVIRKSEDNFVMGDLKELHGANKVPLVQIGTVNRYEDNEIEKLSPLQVVFEDLKEYNTYKSFDTFAKFRNAFPKEIESETSNASGQKQKQVILSPTAGGDNSIPLPFYDTSSTFNSKNSVYGSAFGSTMRVPFQQATNPDFMAQMRNMFFTIESGRDLLDFRAADLQAFEESILENVLGNGFGKTDETAQVRTATEVAASFASQEDTLVIVKQSCELTMGSVIYIYGYMALQDKFQSVYLDLGNTFFLKTTFQAIAELTAIKSVTANEAIIEQKVMDVLVYSSGANVNEIKRFELVRMLQPYANKTPEYIKENTVYFDKFPFALYLYQNFSQILAQFEIANGKIEIYCSDMKNFDELKNVFYEFVVNFFAEQNTLNQIFTPKTESNGEDNLAN